MLIRMDRTIHKVLANRMDLGCRTGRVRHTGQRLLANRTRLGVLESHTDLCRLVIPSIHRGLAILAARTVLADRRFPEGRTGLVGLVFLGDLEVLAVLERR